MNSGTTAFVYVALRVARGAGAGRGARAGSRARSGSGIARRAGAVPRLESLATARAATSGCSTAASPIRRMPSGLWGDVVAQVVRLHRRKRFHKERLTRLFRELRRSTAAMPDGVVMLDPQGEIVWFNRKAGELLDLSRRADLGPAHRQPRAPSRFRAVPARRAIFAAADRAHRHAGRAHIWRSSSSPMARTSAC